MGFIAFFIFSVIYIYPVYFNFALLNKIPTYFKNSRFLTFFLALFYLFYFILFVYLFLSFHCFFIYYSDFWEFAKVFYKGSTIFPYFYFYLINYHLSFLALFVFFFSRASLYITLSVFLKHPDRLIKNPKLLSIFKKVEPFVNYLKDLLFDFNYQNYSSFFSFVFRNFYDFALFIYFNSFFFFFNSFYLVSVYFLFIKVRIFIFNFFILWCIFFNLVLVLVSISSIDILIRRGKGAEVLQHLVRTFTIFYTKCLFLIKSSKFFVKLIILLFLTFLMLLSGLALTFPVKITAVFLIRLHYLSVILFLSYVLILFKDSFVESQCYDSFSFTCKDSLFLILLLFDLVFLSGVFRYFFYSFVHSYSLHALLLPIFNFLQSVYFFHVVHSLLAFHFLIFIFLVLKSLFKQEPLFVSNLSKQSCFLISIGLILLILLWGIRLFLFDRMALWSNGEVINGLLIDCLGYFWFFFSLRRLGMFVVILFIILFYIFYYIINNRDKHV